VISIRLKIPWRQGGELASARLSTCEVRADLQICASFRFQEEFQVFSRFRIYH
jgi:hypothetical protein